MDDGRCRFVVPLVAHRDELVLGAEVVGGLARAEQRGGSHRALEALGALLHAALVVEAEEDLARLSTAATAVDRGATRTMVEGLVPPHVNFVLLAAAEQHLEDGALGARCSLETDENGVGRVRFRLTEDDRAVLTSSCSVWIWLPSVSS